MGFSSPSFGALFDGNAVHLELSGSPSIGSDSIGCKSSEDESAATRPSTSGLGYDNSDPAGRS